MIDSYVPAGQLQEMICPLTMHGWSLFFLYLNDSNG